MPPATNGGAPRRRDGAARESSRHAQKAPRLSVQERYGLPAGSSYTSIPHAVLLLCKRLDLSFAEISVLVVVLDAWWPERDGNVFDVSLADVAELLPTSREYVRQCLWSLNEKQVLGVFAEPGKKTHVDVTPLLLLLGKAPLTVKRGGRSRTKAAGSGRLSTPTGEPSSGADSAVNSGLGAVNSPSLRVDTQSQRKESESERACSASAGEPASHARAGDAAAPRKKTQAELLAQLADLEKQDVKPHGAAEAAS